MKITKQYLTQVIKEEIEQVLNEYNPKSPVVHKVGVLNAGWANRKDAGLNPEDNIGNELLKGFSPGGAARYDTHLMELIRINNDPKKALKFINELAEQKEIDIPMALAAYVIAMGHLYTGTKEGDAVKKAYVNKIEGPKFQMPNYFTIGVGSQKGMRERLEKIFPKLMKAVDESLTASPVKYDYPPGQYTPRGAKWDL
jgi:hypothetical protein